jgi:16S rRNA (guanine(966)-N(2))-methyltransferase RsmD
MAKKKSSLTTNIIAGKYKGKRLALPSLEVTRGSKSILKESFFNTVQFEIIDKIFIESFGGSGSMGLEAISRGANKAYFVELDKNSYKILRQNCILIDEKSTFPILGDTFEHTPKIVSNIGDKSQIILYIDPPFDIRDGMSDIYDKSFAMIEEFSKQNYEFFLICIEHSSELKVPSEIGNYKLSKTKRFGKSSLSYYN